MTQNCKTCLYVYSLVIKLTAWAMPRGILTPSCWQGRLFGVHDTSVLSFSVEYSSKDSSGLWYGVWASRNEMMVLSFGRRLNDMLKGSVKDILPKQIQTVGPSLATQSPTKWMLASLEASHDSA